MSAIGSGAQLRREIVEVACRDVDRCVRLQIRFSIRSEFERPCHERGSQADAFCGSQIAEMRGDHHHFVKLQIQKLRRGLVDLAVRLVVARQFRAEDAVP